MFHMEVVAFAPGKNEHKAIVCRGAKDFFTPSEDSMMMTLTIPDENPVAAKQTVIDKINSLFEPSDRRSIVGLDSMDFYRVRPEEVPLIRQQIRDNCDCPYCVIPYETRVQLAKSLLEDFEVFLKQQEKQIEDTKEQVMIAYMNLLTGTHTDPDWLKE